MFAPGKQLAGRRLGFWLVAGILSSTFGGGIAHADSYAIVTNFTTSTIDVTVEFKNDAGAGKPYVVNGIATPNGTSKGLIIDCPDGKPANAFKINVSKAPHNGSTGWVDGFNLNGFSGVIFQVTQNGYVNIVAPSGPATKSAQIK